MLSFFNRNAQPSEPAEPKPGLGARLRAGLQRTRDQFSSRVAGLFTPRRPIDEALFEELEEVLLTSDVGVSATGHLIGELRRRAREQRLADASELRGALRECFAALLAPLARPLEVAGHHPFVIMMVGVNGSGKTTSIGKLAWRLRAEGRSVLLAAGDTFRAAAREQLMAWGERNGVQVIAQQGGDSAAVIFDAINAAKARGTDVVLADTAGRLATQMHLMEEIRKVKRVIAKADPGAPHEVLLTLDANTGQNAVSQVKAFDDALGVTGLVVTKLDGTARGGVIAAIARERPIPVRFVGVGEAIEDLRAFDAADYAGAIFDQD